ncbi:MAG: HAMP domain-containing sensor histidine kinase [Pseudomonadota bacterium]
MTKFNAQRMAKAVISPTARALSRGFRSGLSAGHAFWSGLSGRLLILTVVFVMLAEVLIFMPSVARYRLEYLHERLEKAQIASLALTASPSGDIDPSLSDELLAQAEVVSIAFKRDGVRELMLAADASLQMAGGVDATFDLRTVTAWELLRDALACALVSERRFIRVLGQPTMRDGDLVEVVIDEWKLKTAMMDYGVRIFWLSLAISAITATLVFFSVNFFLVRPVQRVIEGIVRFREDPEDADRVMRLSGVGGEIGVAEIELAETQREVQSALRQKRRLAALGEAVAKISHDLRNILASTQLLADRLETSKDPVVQRVSPKLLASLDRAIRLCQQTLTYGRADEPPPTRTPVDPARLLEELRAALGLAEGGPIRFEAAIEPGLAFEADSDQLFRALLNLCRNAVQAIDATSGAGALAVAVRREGPAVLFEIADDGPGLPEKARDNLFRPFKGSARRGGSGLGVVIAYELVKGHGGALELIESTPEGTRFRITLPA